jgi:hypothetical protein
VPSAYHLYQLRRMPDRDQFGTQANLYLKISGATNLEDCHTTMRLAQTGFRFGVDKFIADHDFLTRLKYPGRASGMQFSEYVSPYRFSVYVDRNEGPGSPILIVQTKALVATDFIKRMNKLEEFFAIERQLDFTALRPQMRTITGGWFGNMQAANLSSTGMYGPNVDRSDEFIHAETIGTLRALSGPYSYDGSTFYMSVTQTGAVVLNNAFDNEIQPLDIVLDIKRRLLDSCWLM